VSLYPSARVPSSAVAQATGAMHEIRESARDLLIEHLRDHVKRTGGLLECRLCVEAHERIHHVSEVLAGDYFA
jgi:hypothetical protein